MALIFGTLAGVGIFQGAPFFLQRIGASPDITVHALAYLRCRAIACPALLSLFVATGSFRGFQDTKYAPGAFYFSSLPIKHSLIRVLPGTLIRNLPSCAVLRAQLCQLESCHHCWIGSGRVTMLNKM